nr:cohesin domain-containing protein [Gracilibacillus sp. YIM 98692]
MPTVTAAEEASTTPYQMEYLERGVVAVNTDDGIFVSWRLLGTESKDTGFNLYRDGTKINDAPITSSTNYLDEEGTMDSVYSVNAVLNGEEVDESKEVAVWGDQYHSIPLDRPEGGTTPDGVSYTYHANDASVGDLDGDGEYEIILKWDPSNSKDNSHSGYTGEVFMDAYELDGTKLWRIGLGKNIRAGAHYTQFMVYDLDSDGKAEVALKTADGTTDATGKVIGDPEADYRNESGRILEGPEYLTVFNGETGEELVTTDFSPARGNMADWGDSYGNRGDRFLAGIAYLDGQKPSLVMTRGYYEKTMLTAYNFRDGELTKQWTFDSDDEGNQAYTGQGNHSLAIADVDDDGKDEIVFGAMVVDHDGKGLYTTGWGHGDANHVSDLNPNRDGMEIFQVHESSNSPVGYGIRDAETGELLFGIETGSDVGRGMAADIDPRYDGAEFWASDSWDGSSGRSPLHSVEGEVISEISPQSMNFAIWWDGDLSRELLDHDWTNYEIGIGTPRIDKWDYENEELNNLLTIEGTSSNNGTKGNPSLQADIIGDWREEVMVRDIDSTELRLYTTTDITEHRFHTLMHDPVYRLSVAWQNVAYNQPPHTSYFLGNDMEEAPKPNADYIVPSTVDVNPDTLDGKLKGDLTINVQVPANAAVLTEASTEFKINGQTVSGNVSTVNKGYQVKMDRREFVRALDRQTGDVEVSVSITSETGEIFVGTDTVNVQTLEPALSVQEADDVKVGDSFSLTYTASGEGDNVRSMEMNLTYDSELLEFVSVDSLVEKLKISHDSKQAGEVHLTVKGTPNRFFNNPDLLKVNMKAKDTEAFTTDVALTDIAYTTTGKEVIPVDDVIQSIDLYDDVSEIIVSGEDGDESIDTNRGSLQLLAQVSPANANQSVEWSVTDVDGSDTELASITSDGLLSANDEGLNGEVKVIAEAMDESGVVGEIVVDISNQLQLITGTPFGAGPPWAPGAEFDKALDGDITTFYDYSEANGGYTGIDVGEDNQEVLSEVRFYPREGFTGRMTGGKIQGSNVSETEGFVDLYTISSEPESGWNVAEITTEESYRYLRYISPDGGYGNIAELEFYHGEQ